LAFPETQSQFQDAVMEYDRVRAMDLVAGFVQRNGAFPEFLEVVLQPVLFQIGELWSEGEIALSQVFLAGKLCEELVATYLPESIAQPSPTAPRRAIVTLSDFHVLGKKVVRSFFLASGVFLEDYGHGISAEQAYQRVQHDKLDFLLVSVLMYPAALEIRKLRDWIDRDGLQTRILAGGAPFLFDRQLAEKVGAHAWAPDPTRGMEILRGWEEEATWKR